MVLHYSYAANPASFCPVSPPGIALFAVKKGQKPPAINGLRFPKFLSRLGRRSKILTAAPAPAPCFRRRRRSPVQQGAGPTAKGTCAFLWNLRGGPWRSASVHGCKAERAKPFLGQALQCTTLLPAARWILSLRRPVTATPLPLIMPPLKGEVPPQEAERFSIAALLRVPLKPPLCKGRWHGKAVAEGL
jgi:hypothetical protein